MPIDHPRYRTVDGTALIEIRLDNLQQLFNTLDPSPFSTRDLDAGAEEYLIAAVEELYRHHRLRLRFIVADAEQQGLNRVPCAIHGHFDYRRGAMDRQIRALFREGRLAFLIGVAFLIGCLSLSRIVLGLELGIAGSILSEGLSICSWVAMWRPIEIFLFDWWPLSRRRRVFATLASSPIEAVLAREPLDERHPG